MLAFAALQSFGDAQVSFIAFYQQLPKSGITEATTKNGSQYFLSFDTPQERMRAG
jgi:hypothetical protein